jgi:hypothetical protein
MIVKLQFFKKTNAAPWNFVKKTVEEERFTLDLSRLVPQCMNFILCNVIIFWMLLNKKPVLFEQFTSAKLLNEALLIVKEIPSGVQKFPLDIS